MAIPDAYAMILAGGGGTRLWPASRRKRPKQLLSLGGSESLLGATFRRTEAVFGRERILVVTAADQVEAGEAPHEAAAARENRVGSLAHRHDALVKHRLVVREGVSLRDEAALDRLHEQRVRVLLQVPDHVAEEVQ